MQRILQRFPDGELHIEVQDSVRGCDVRSDRQPTCPPVDEHFFELFLLADACRRAGATHLTAVIPYFGYARQDRRAHGREPVSTRLAADLIAASAIQRVVVVDFHSRAVESAFAIPVEHVSAIPILAEAVQPSVHKDAVVVSPDLGAVKMAERYAKLLNLSVAIIHKSRVSGAEVTVQRIVGDVPQKRNCRRRRHDHNRRDDREGDQGAGRSRLLIFRYKSRGESRFVRRRRRRAPRTAADRKDLRFGQRAPAQQFPLPLVVSSLASLLAETIQRLHRLESLGDVWRTNNVPPSNRANPICVY